jgi:outer membrane protein assembly factor BamE (lipoprotein component of BamABCDE complex)
MLMARTLLRSAALLGSIAILGLTAGCARIRDHKGYVPDSTLIGTVAPGIDNRESVTKTLGRPSFAGQFDKDRTWYYVSRETRQIGYRTPKPASQMILAVHFDEKGNVSAVERTGMEKVVHITPLGDKTPTLGSKRGFFRELFGNIGRVGSVGTGSNTADNPN